jgi:cell division septum initiation protein DivIVA
MSSAGLSQVTTAPAQGDTSGNAHLPPGQAPEERFGVARRGYDRRQVEEFVARSSREAVGLRNRLVKALREVEQLRIDLAAARQAAWEAGAQRERAARELAVLRTHAEMALARNLWWPSLPPDGG